MTTIIKFTAQGCGQCKMLEPIFFKAVHPFIERASVQSFDIDEMTEIAQKYSVQHVPTIIIMHDGAEVERLEGVVTEKKLTETIEKYVGGDAK